MSSVFFQKTKIVFTYHATIISRLIFEQILFGKLQFHPFWNTENHRKCYHWQNVGGESFFEQIYTCMVVVVFHWVPKKEIKCDYKKMSFLLQKWFTKDENISKSKIIVLTWCIKVKWTKLNGSEG